MNLGKLLPKPAVANENEIQSFMGGSGSSGNNNNNNNNNARDIESSDTKKNIISSKGIAVSQKDDDDDDDDSDDNINNNNNNNNNNSHNNDNLVGNTDSDDDDGHGHHMNDGFNTNRVSQVEVRRRIQAYLEESDENCKESTTLVAIIVIGLIVAGTVIGFLQIGQNKHVTYKGSHVGVEHANGEKVSWWQENADRISNEDAPPEERYVAQPLYRNDLLQSMYDVKPYNSINSQSPFFRWVSVLYGSWVPTAAQLQYAFYNQSLVEREITQEESEYDETVSVKNETEDETGRRRQIEKLEGLKDLRFLPRGQNVHRVLFPPKRLFPGPQFYDHNINQWYCYLAQFFYMDKMKEHYPNGFTIRTSLRFQHFNMEPGYDYVRVFVNSKEELVLTGAFTERVLYNYFNSEEISNSGNAIEICYNVVTDESEAGEGFEALFKIEYENPDRVSWKNTYYGECHSAKPNGSNPSRWDGSCGVGITQRSIFDCVPVNISVASLGPASQVLMPSMFIDAQQAIELEKGYCEVGATDIKYCIKNKCENVDTSKAPDKPAHFNGISRIDPTYPDPFAVYRSINEQFSVSDIIAAVKKTIKTLETEHSDTRFFNYSVTNWGPGFENSRWRLGIKMARSLLLGDSFTVAFSGSSNTAGHENMFLSSYPMQLQSLLRPLWRSVGYKGAAFVVKNQAVGGSLGTNQTSWCLAELIGEDADVVFWESIMNDLGRPFPNVVENHLRVAISLKRRPVWHAMIAGGNNGQPLTFKRFELNAAYKELADYYDNVGAGLVEFFPSNGINPLAKSDNKYSQDRVYVSWHPGPRGHRYYAQIIAHFYLNSLLTVLNAIAPTMEKLKTNVPTLEMYDLLQDIPADSTLPVGKYCGNVCVSSKTRWCITGMVPSDITHSLQWYNATQTDWKWQVLAWNSQSFTNKDGGQASIDAKYGFVGNKTSGVLDLVVKTKGKNYLLIHRPYSDWGKLDNVVATMRNWLHIQLDGNAVECIKPDTAESQGLWMVDEQFRFGCVIPVNGAEDKSTLSLLISGDIDGTKIPIWTISTF